MALSFEEQVSQAGAVAPGPVPVRNPLEGAANPGVVAAVTAPPLAPVAGDRPNVLAMPLDDCSDAPPVAVPLAVTPVAATPVPSEAGAGDCVELAGVVVEGAGVASVLPP